MSHFSNTEITTRYLSRFASDEDRVSLNMLLTTLDTKDITLRSAFMLLQLDDPHWCDELDHDTESAIRKMYYTLRDSLYSEALSSLTLADAIARYRKLSALFELYSPQPDDASMDEDGDTSRDQDYRNLPPFAS